MKPVSFYVTVTNMDEAIVFYNRLFEAEPKHSDARYSYYDLFGFSFGLFYAAYDRDVIITGNNSVLCFKIDYIENSYARIKDLAKSIDASIFETAHVRLFQFTDPYDNRLEVFQEK